MVSEPSRSDMVSGCTSILQTHLIMSASRRNLLHLPERHLVNEEAALNPQALLDGNDGLKVFEPEMRIQLGHRLGRVPSQLAEDRIRNLASHRAVEEVAQRMEVETAAPALILCDADLAQRRVE